jgi:hypothetical protein
MPKNLPDHWATACGNGTANKSVNQGWVRIKVVARLWVLPTLKIYELVIGLAIDSFMQL